MQKVNGISITSLVDKDTNFLDDKKIGSVHDDIVGKEIIDN